MNTADAVTSGKCKSLVVQLPEAIDPIANEGFLDIKTDRK